MKLNVGSGEHPTTDMADWVDVDLIWYGVKPPHGVHGDAFSLPFRDDAFDAAYLGHTLEHIWREDLARLGEELRRVLADNAEVIVVGPDMDRACEQHQPDWLLSAIVGESNMAGPGGHKWPPTEAATIAACELMGLKDIRPWRLELTMRPHWPNVSTASWQTCLKAST